MGRKQKESPWIWLFARGQGALLARLTKRNKHRQLPATSSWRKLQAIAPLSSNSNPNLDPLGIEFLVGTHPAQPKARRLQACRMLAGLKTTGEQFAVE